MLKLKAWREAAPDPPDGPWFKDFGSFKLCGEGKYPKNRLLVWRIASQIRLDRRAPVDEVVRVTLQDEDGAVLFEGEVR